MSSLGFSERCEVVVQQLDDKNWAVCEEFSYTGHKETWRIYEGMETDFASIPRVFVWFLPRYGRYTKAAIVHDYLWRERAAPGKMDWIDADGVFRQAMRELGVPFLRRWIMWAAVRWAALVRPRGLRRWWREAPRVLIVTLVALPVLAPPAVVVGLALVVFLLMEVVVWLALLLASSVRRILNRPTPKAVNRPEFSWRLA